LLHASGPWRSFLSAGAAFAAMIRSSAGMASPELEATCEILCQASMMETMQTVERIGWDLHTNQYGGYDGWRERIRALY
jgi:hypothetical protein